MYIKFGFSTAVLALTAMLSAPAFAGGITLDSQGKLTMSFKSFINITSLTEKQNGVNTNDKTGLAVDRFYVNMGYKINNVWSAHITTDVNNEQPQNTGLQRQMNVFLKYAYLQGDFSRAMRLRLGLASTPWIGYEQKL